LAVDLASDPDAVIDPVKVRTNVAMNATAPVGCELPAAFFPTSFAIAADTVMDPANERVRDLGKAPAGVELPETGFDTNFDTIADGVIDPPFTSDIAHVTRADNVRDPAFES
jgi:hypothetical protein